MSKLTTDQVISELRKRGVSEEEISFAKLDNQYKFYQGYLAENVGLQGEEDYKLVQKEFSEVAGKRAKVFADMQAKAADDPSMSKKIDAIARGVNETYLSDIAGLPVDAVNKVILEPMGLGTDEPMFGSKNLSRTLQAFGMGYYDSSKPRTISGSSDPATYADMPPSTRPYAVAGEEAATALSMAAPIGLAARSRTAMQLANPSRDAMVPLSRSNPLAPIENTRGFLRNSINDMIDLAAKNPKKFYKMETSVAFLSGVGGGLAETIAPGDPTARMIGSIVAPLSPTALPIAAQGSYTLLNKVTGGSVEKLRNAITTRLRGSEGTLDAAGRAFQNAVVAEGANPKDLAKLINDWIKKNPQYANQQGNLSAGLATGDDTLLAIERSLIAGDSEISKQAGAQTAASIQEMKDLYSSVLKISDNNPELLREIADARVDHLNFVTNLRVSKAVRKLDLMQKSLSAVSAPNINKAKEVNAQKIKKIFDDVYDDLRTTEDQLWNKIDKTIRLSGDETESAIRNLSAETDGLRGIALPSVLKKMQNVGYDSKSGLSSISSGDLLKARSDLGKQIRVAMRGESPDRDLARRLINLQNSITNDLAKSGNSAQIRLANNATRNRYEFLELPVVSKMRQRSIGGKVNKPDLVLDEMLLGAKRSQHAYQTFNDIIEAGAKGQIRSVAGYTKATKELVDPLARFYYAMANDVIGVSGKVNLEKLGSFLTKHEQGLKALGIYDNLKMPEVQAHLVKQLQESNKKLSSNYMSKSMAAKIIGAGDVNNSVNKMLFYSPTRHKDLKSLVNLSRKKAPGVNNAKALEGIQQSFVDNLLEQSVVKYRPPGAKDFSELVSGQKILDALSKKQGKFTLEEDLISSRLISKSQMDAIKAMANRAKMFEESVLKRASGGTIKNIPPDSDYLIDILGRLGGATMAAASPLGQGIGHQLIIAQIGSQAGRSFLQKLPNIKLTNVMKEAMLDPLLMKNLLERPATIIAKKNRDYKLRALMVSKGLLEEEEAYNIEGAEGQTNQIKTAIKVLAEHGKSRGEIMTAFENQAREEGTSIGPYVLDQVQSILDISEKERIEIMEKFEKERKPYTLKRRGGFGKPIDIIDVGY